MWEPAAAPTGIESDRGLLGFIMSQTPTGRYGFVHDLSDEVVRQRVVVQELHMIRSASLGDAVQLRLIIEHLGKRHLCLDDLLFPTHLHTADAAAARI